MFDVSISISGPATIQCLSAPRFPVNPIAPPEPFTIAFSWSIAIAENLLFTTKCPDMSSARTSGCQVEENFGLVLKLICLESNLLENKSVSETAVILDGAAVV